MKANVMLEDKTDKSFSTIRLDIERFPGSDNVYTFETTPASGRKHIHVVFGFGQGVFVRYTTHPLADFDEMRRLLGDATLGEQMEDTRNSYLESSKIRLKRRPVEEEIHRLLGITHTPFR